MGNRNLTKLTFYGGVGEIGGNKILVETEDGSVLLDFGRRMGVTGSYYSEFLQVRTRNALRDLLRLGVLPWIDGVYDEKYLDTTRLLENPGDIEKIPVDMAQDYWISEAVEPYDSEDPGVDAVFISHAHFDHIQDVSFLDPDIPLITTPETEIISKAICDLSASSIDLQFYELRRPSRIVSKPWHYKTLHPGELDYKRERVREKPLVLDEKTGYTFCREYMCETRNYVTEPCGQVKGLDYRLIPVGHSIPGACSVLLTTPDGKRILYTGDLRFHGAKGITKQEYVEQVGGSVDLLIIEGTRVDSMKVLTEEEIRREIMQDIQDTMGLVLIDFGWKDLSRFSIIHQAVQHTDRVFVINPKLAYLLYEMHCHFPEKYPDPRTMPNLRVYLKREGSMLYSKNDYDKYKMGYLHHHGRNRAKRDQNIVRIAEKLGVGGDPENTSNPLPDPNPGEPYKHRGVYDLATHHLEHGVRAYEIRENPGKYVLMFSYWDCNELYDLIPENRAHDTRYIRASTEPFNDEMKIDEQKFINWLNHFNIKYDYEVDTKDNKMFQARHVSGHLSQPEIKELVNKLNPEQIIPIHTEHPETYKQLFGEQVKLVKHRETVELT